MKYRAKKCIFDPCFMLYVPDLLLWKVHLACIPAISTGTPRKSLWKQIIQQLECNRIQNPNWHWRQPLKLLTIKAATKNKSGKWPQQDSNQGLLDCNFSDVVPYSASHFLLSMAFHNFCLRGGELYIQLNLHESLHNGHVSITAIFWRTVHTFTLVSTSLQWPLSSVPKVAVVEGFNCSTLSSYQEPCKVLDRHQCSFNILLSLASFVFIVIPMI